MSALLPEMANLKGKAAFESMECTFPFTRCIRQGGVEAPRVWLKMAVQILWNLEEEWQKRKMLLRSETGQKGFHQICSFRWVNNYWILSQSQKILGQMVKELVEEVKRWDREPKQATCGGRVPMPARRRRTW